MNIKKYVITILCLSLLILQGCAISYETANRTVDEYLEQDDVEGALVYIYGNYSVPYYYKLRNKVRIYQFKQARILRDEKIRNDQVLAEKLWHERQDRAEKIKNEQDAIAAAEKRERIRQSQPIKDKKEITLASAKNTSTPGSCGINAADLIGKEFRLTVDKPNLDGTTYEHYVIWRFVDEKMAFKMETRDYSHIPTYNPRAPRNYYTWRVACDEIIVQGLFVYSFANRHFVLDDKSSLILKEFTDYRYTPPVKEGNFKEKKTTIYSKAEAKVYKLSSKSLLSEDEIKWLPNSREMSYDYFWVTYINGVTKKVPI